MQHPRNYSHGGPPQPRGHRPGAPPLNPSQPHAAQLQHQNLKAADDKRREQAWRQSRKPTDRNLPDGIDDVVIGDGPALYRRMRDVERRLDATMVRKRLEMNEVPNSSRRYRTMRIWISNTAENQPWQDTAMQSDAFDFSTDNHGTFRVRIDGKLLEEDDAFNWEDDEQPAKEDEKTTDGTQPSAGNAPKTKVAPPAKTRFSHFFKQIVIDFDRSRTMTNADSIAQIEWKRPEMPRGGGSIAEAGPGANFDYLEFERKGDENVNVVIKLVRDEFPDRFKLTHKLARLLDMEEADRGEVMMGLWQYVKAMRLPEDEESRRIHCDDALRSIFQTDTLFFPQLAELLHPHLIPLPPVELRYTIRVDAAYINQSNPSSPPTEDNSQSDGQPTATSYGKYTIYDIPVALPPVARNPPPHYSITTLQKLAALDDALAATVSAINDSFLKWKFYQEMATDPVNFVRRWVSSQTRDLEIFLGEAPGFGEEGRSEEWRRGGEDGVWGSREAKEGVGLWVARRGGIP